MTYVANDLLSRPVGSGCTQSSSRGASTRNKIEFGMTVIRTTEHSDTDPSWPGAAVASLADLPRLLRTDLDLLNAAR
jgi:hypothetical protein